MSFHSKTKIPKLRLVLSAGLVLFSLLFITGCATGGGDESEVDDLAGSAAPADAEFAESGDPLAQSDSDFDSQSASQEGDTGSSDDKFLDDSSQSDQQAAAPNDSESDMNQAEGSQDDLNLDDFDEKQQAESNPPIEEAPPLVEEPPREESVPIAETPPPPMEILPPVSQQKPIEITNLSYKANESGGTVVIEGSGPIAYTTRFNQDLRQLVVEVPNSTLPTKLRRSLNTKDFKGAIGAIDAYQAPGMKVSRFVIQLRDGAAEPFIQVEGNSLLIVSSDAGGSGNLATAATLSSPGDSIENGTEEGQLMTADPVPDGDLNINLNDSRILSSQSLSEFLSGSSKFYGKKISVEFPRTDLRQAIRFFMEETGVNMIIDQDVSGEVTMKLRQVPWDQAFITMLRMSNLSYQRQGSILRIATVKKLQTEEKDAVELMDLKKLTEPLKIRNFFINFADLTETVNALKAVLKNGAKESITTKIVVDAKNGKIIVQDTEENLELIEKFVKNLDVPIKQVLIEAKIVEASEKFTRSIGINWNLSDGAQAVGGQTVRPTLSVGQPGSGKDLDFGLSYGTLPLLGNLGARLTLAELDNTVKVVSAPRIMTLTGNAATVNVTDTVSSLNQSVDTKATSAPVVNTYTSTAIPTVLTVTPNVTPDNFVTLKVQISRTIGTLNATGRVDTGTRSIDTNILVRDGQTATIGGLYQTDQTEGTNGVPGLKDIPFIGALFRGKQELRSKTELLIFLTPRVMTLDFHGAQTKNEGTL